MSNLFSDEDDRMSDGSVDHAQEHVEENPNSTGESQPLGDPDDEPMGDAGVAQKESKTQKNLNLIFDPEKCDNDKSLWQFFLKEVSKMPTVDELAALNHGENEMDKILVVWYGQILAMYRTFLQTAFEEPLELSALGRRIARFTATHRALTDDWRQRWVEKYKQDYVPTKAANAALNSLEARKAAAVEKRRKLAEQKRAMDV